MSARGFAAAGALLLILTGPVSAAVEIQWWHAMQGERGRQLERLVRDFNDSQSEYRIVPVHKGTYAETLAAAIVALRSRQQPPIVQVLEVATATMMAAKGAIYPVHELMRDQGEDVRSVRLSPADHRLLQRPRRQHAVVSVQQLDPDPLLQQGSVPRRGLDPDKPPAHLARGRSGRAQAG